MPIYEYRCPKCNKIFEEWSQHITEDHPQEPCPDCGTLSPRIMSETSFVLEGGGWYVTDYGYRKGIKDETTSHKSSPSPAKTESSSAASSSESTSAPSTSSSATSTSSGSTASK